MSSFGLSFALPYRVVVVDLAAIALETRAVFCQIVQVDRHGLFALLPQVRHRAQVLDVRLEQLQKNVFIMRKRKVYREFRIQRKMIFNDKMQSAENKDRG